MIRALFRLLSMIALAVAVIMAVLDATRSIAADALVLTPLGESWSAVAPQTLEDVQGLLRALAPDALADAILAQLLAAPGFAVVAIVSLVFHVIGRRRRRRREGFVTGP